MGVMGTPFPIPQIFCLQTSSPIFQRVHEKKTGTTRVPSFLIHLKIYLIIPEQFQQQY